MRRDSKSIPSHPLLSPQSALAVVSLCWKYVTWWADTGYCTSGTSECRQNFIHSQEQAPSSLCQRAGWSQHIVPVASSLSEETHSDSLEASVRICRAAEWIFWPVQKKKSSFLQPQGSLTLRGASCQLLLKQLRGIKSVECKLPGSSSAHCSDTPGHSQGKVLVLKHRSCKRRVQY